MLHWICSEDWSQSQSQSRSYSRSHSRSVDLPVTPSQMRARSTSDESSQLAQLPAAFSSLWRRMQSCFAVVTLIVYSSAGAVRVCRGRCMMGLFSSELSDSDDEVNCMAIPPFFTVGFFAVLSAAQGSCWPEQAMPLPKLLQHTPSGCELRAFGMEFGQTTGYDQPLRQQSPCILRLLSLPSPPLDVSYQLVCLRAAS